MTDYSSSGIKKDASDNSSYPYEMDEMEGDTVQTDTLERNSSPDPNLEDLIQNDALAEAYSQGKEVILEDLSKKLNNKQYAAALKIVEDYESVAKSDPKFQVLAQMARDYKSREDQIEILQTKLKAIPKSNVLERIEIQNKLHELDPANFSYIDPNAAQKKPFMTTGAFIASLPAVIVGLLLLIAVHDITAILTIIGCAIAFLLLTNIRINPMRSNHTIVRMFAGFGIVFVFFMIGIIGFRVPSHKNADTVNQGTEITAPAEPGKEAPDSKTDTQITAPAEPQAESNQDQ